MEVTYDGAKNLENDKAQFLLHFHMLVVYTLANYPGSEYPNTHFNRSFKEDYAK